MHTAVCPVCNTSVEVDFRPAGGLVWCPTCQKAFVPTEFASMNDPDMQPKLGQGTADEDSKIAELNEALSWLADRQGRIGFSIEPGPAGPIVTVECTEKVEGKSEATCRYCRAVIDSGNVSSAMLAAIKAMRITPESRFA